MRKVLFFFILLTVCLSASAQKNQKKNTNTKPELIIANEEMNVLYRGYDNKLIISVSGVASSNLVLQSEGATFTQEGNHWICRVTSNSNEVAIYVSAKNKRGTELIGSKTYRVRTLPNPVAYIKLANGELWTAERGPLDRTKFEGATIVAEYGPNEIVQPNFTVTGFKLVVSDGKGGSVALLSDGNKFSIGQINAISKLKSGTTLKITNIEYTGAVFGNNLPLEPIILQ